MDTIYELLLWFWGVMGADSLPYYINTLLYMVSFLFFLVIITIPFWFVIIIRIIGKAFGSGYND